MKYLVFEDDLSIFLKRGTLKKSGDYLFNKLNNASLIRSLRAMLF
ncbi:hypothetical protein CLERM_248 [Coxiella-like endosymbiont]|nr:hypothetical protein CLERM_248 [Coxiella-like endosymbiont]